MTAAISTADVRGSYLSNTEMLLGEVVGTEVANHCQGNVRRIAARGLGRIGSTSSNPQIIHHAEQKLIWALLNPEDWGLRYAAAVALHQALKQEADKVVQSRILAAVDS